MPVLPPISVTQSTAPSVNASTATDASAWADALASTAAPPQSGATSTADAPVAPKQTAGSKKDAGQTQAAAIADANGLTVEPSKTTKAGKPQSVYTPPQPSRDAKTDAHLAVAVVAPALQTQPVPEKPTAPGNEKAPGEAVQKATQTTAEIGAEAAGTTTSQTPPGSSMVTAKAGPAMAPAPKGSDTTTSKAAVATATPSSNAQPNLLDMPPAAASGPQADSATTQNTATVSSSKAAAQPPASQPVTASTAQALTARAAQISESIAITPKEKEKLSVPAVSALGGATAHVAGFSVASAGSTTPHANEVVENSSTAPAALAATITALHQSGQAGTVLRLDPPGLGHLSVEVRLGAQGQVNVLFVPSTADAAQALHASLPGLGSAMAQSGLTLGQAQVGGQFSQQSGQNNQGGYTPPRQNNTLSPAAEPQTTQGGLSAYA
ncbi:MAG: flagellar hook-length control protein FliK [Rhodospirillales bacterium]|nr:flagellar hook-length control protein FliK [Rhodospirillales bacterium]